MILSPRVLIFWIVALFFCQIAFAQFLPLPLRSTNALSGSDFAQSIASLERPEREQKIYEQVAAGNVPDFLRKLVPINVQFVRSDHTNTAIYFVTPDYLAV